MQRFSFSERTAITSEGNTICLWTPSGSKGGRIFKNSKGSAILYSDDGWWWNRNKQEAEHCFYAEWWMGEFPYGSWCWAIRVCKTTGEVDVQTIETEINPRGMSDQDIWRRECRSYVPQQIVDSLPA